MIPRIDDFTSKELDALQKAVLFRLSYIEIYPSSQEPNEVEQLQLWRTQIRTAMVDVLIREKINSN